MPHSIRIDRAAPISESIFSDLPEELMTLITKDPKLSSRDMKAIRLACKDCKSIIDQNVTNQTIYSFKDLSQILHFTQMGSLKVTGDKRSKTLRIATVIFMFFKDIITQNRLNYAHSEAQLVRLQSFCSSKYKIEQLDFKVLKPLKNLEHLHIEGVNDLTTEILNSVTELNQLKSLTIGNCPNVGLSSLKNLGQISGLQTLQIELSPDKYSQVGLYPHRDERNAESTLAAFSQLRELRNFEINGYASAAVSQLSRCEQNNIERLKIDRLSMDMIEQLSNWSKLEKLTINNSLEHDVVFALGRLKQIRSFAFAGFYKLTMGFTHLQSMNSLQKLKIGPAHMTYRGLNTITQLTSLKTSNAAITHMGLITNREPIFQQLHLRKVVLDSELFDRAELIRSLISVEVLKMSRVILTKEAIKELSSLIHLRKLEITEAVLPGNFDLSHLPKFEKLTSLKIDIFKGSGKQKYPTIVNSRVLEKLRNFEPFGSSGLNTLEYLARLSVLTLSGLSLDNGQMNLISSIPLLQRLDVRGCEVSQQIIEDLADQRPNLTILGPENDERSQSLTEIPSFFRKLIRKIKTAFSQVFNWLGFGPRSLRA